MVAMFLQQDQKYMNRALDLAELAKGRTSPNPLVGCVIVKNDEIIGEGYHQKAGTPHAEVHALQAAGAEAFGATAYVTLEPCAHFGRTPPCANALVEAGVSRVVVAMLDPNPLVAGKGIQILKENGIQVEVGLEEERAKELNKFFLKSIEIGLPYVLYKSAMTLDGKIATESGDSKWITNDSSRVHAHHLRNEFDVILVGSETVQQDNPLLNCRVDGGRDPIRLIIDGQLRISPDAAVLTSSDTAPCIIATSQKASQDKVLRLQNMANVEVWQFNTPRHVPLKEVLQKVVKRGWNSVLLEGGGSLAGIFLQEKLIDEVEFIIAPKLIGGNGPSPLSGLNLEKMSEAITLQVLAIDDSTGDIRVRGKVNY